MIGEEEHLLYIRLLTMGLIGQIYIRILAMVHYPLKYITGK